MKKSQNSLLSVLFISAVLFWIYYSMMPRWIADEQLPLSDFSTNRALSHVAEISKNPHYTGSDNHKAVADYIAAELKKLGLEPEIQEGTTLSDWGNLVKSRNIIARIKGTGSSKALLLLSHYDSAPHSYSHGAADDASGVATIIEGIRAFLYTKQPHKNDVIILFTDAEELGLNGAALFVTQHKWAKEIGVALNFEARGTSGPSYMLMEVNQGNSAMVDGFSEADTDFPVSNSLMYSIYKMLPNDTDLTVFREQGKIPGYNFAFIDSHFNYHTQQDDLAHLSRESLAHQGSYLMPLMKYYSNAELATINSADDQVYFNTPFNFIHYPFAWNFILLAIAVLIFLFLVFIGLGKRLLFPAEIGKGFILFLSSMALCGAITYFGWNFLLGFYPEYNDILQGFTYNGHYYIAAFAFLSLAVTFLFYIHANNDGAIHNYTVAPLLIWLLINLGLAVFLPGAGFFVIPVLFSLLMFGYFIVTQNTSNLVNLVLAIPSLIVFVPFIVMFPIGLGLKLLAGSAVLIVLVFGLLLPIFGQFRSKPIWSVIFFLISVGFFVYADINSGYDAGKAKPNSLLYVYDAEKDKALWATYDKNLDDWTRTYLTEKHEDGRKLAGFPLFSKYNSDFTYTSDALVRDLPEPGVSFLMDSVIGTQRYMKIRISPNRKVNRYDIFADEKMTFHNLKANGATALGQKGSRYLRKGKKILSYYVVDNEPLELQFSIPKDDKFDMQLLESSFDLMTNPLFRMQKRAKWMMPTPFVLNDAIVVLKKIKPTPVENIPVPVRKNFALPETVSDTIPDADEPME